MAFKYLGFDASIQKITKNSYDSKTVHVAKTQLQLFKTRHKFIILKQYKWITNNEFVEFILTKKLQNKTNGALYNNWWVN